MSIDVYDLSVIKDAASNDAGLIKEMLELFISKTNEEMVMLKEYIANEDWEKTYFMAHKLKPSFIYLRMSILEKCMEDIEERAKNMKQVEKIPELFESCQSIFTDTIKVLTKEIK